MKKNSRFLIAIIFLVFGATFTGCFENKDEFNTKVDTNIESSKDNIEKKEFSSTENKDINNNKEEGKKDISKENEEINKKEETDIQKIEEEERSYKAYYIDDTASFLNYKLIKGDKEILNPQNILDQIGNGLNISPNTKVLNCTITEYNTIILNLTKDIYDIKVGSGVGAMRVEGIARTYISALGANNCIIQVEGEGYSDGHMMLDKYEAVL